MDGDTGIVQLCVCVKGRLMKNIRTATPTIGLDQFVIGHLMRRSMDIGSSNYAVFIALINHISHIKWPNK